MVKEKEMRKKTKFQSTYLVGPMDDVSLAESKNWREMITRELSLINISVLNPILKYGINYANIRQSFANWSRFGNVEAIRKKVREEIIPPDMEMVENCNFITMFMPAEGAEICGSYGEITVAHYLSEIFKCPKCKFRFEKKPIYIITRRRLKPLNVPKWATGCSTKIFKTWVEYLEHVKEHHGAKG